MDKPSLLILNIKQLQAIRTSFILVHGGGKLASALSEKIGIQTHMINGRRITDAQTLDIVTMVYAGLINKKIVARMQAIGKNAIGICGADLHLITATKRSRTPIDFGFVGDIKDINTEQLRLLIDNGCVPVFSSITHDGKGQLLNTNADTIASALAISLGNLYNVTLCYCFEKNGVLLNPDDEQSVIAELSEEKYEMLKAAGNIYSGMIPKLDNAFAAFSQDISSVQIMHALQLQHFINSGYAGTKLVK
jgi:acetylglutamate kinase